MAKPKPSPSTVKPAAERPPQISLKTKLLALIISPVLFLLLMELVLRLLGWGIPSRFWIPWSGQGQKVMLSNPEYCQHFVPKSLSREPAFSALAVPKPATTRRVVVLGGSAAYGDPEVDYGFCRQLEFLLNDHAQGVRFEVINAAVTSMNSHVALRIARDAMRHDPDLLLAFMGNNEVVGPYGPPTLSASLYEKRWFIDLSIAAKQRLRLGQLIAHLARRTQAGADSNAEWLGMEAFLSQQIAADSNKLTACYRHFRENLKDIVRSAYAGGIQVLFCVPPVNLQDCAPFASRHRDDLTDEALALWDQHWQAGRALEEAKDWQGAWDRYQQAVELDDRYADLRFSRGRCAVELGRTEEALAEFEAARDLDSLRFRADSQQQDIIRGIGTKIELKVLDLQQELQRTCDDGILGQEYLVDHVHLNFNGNFQSAWLALGRIQMLMPEELTEPDESAKSAWLMKTQERLLYGSMGHYETALVMYQRKTRPPFAGQLGHEQELAALRDELVHLRHRAKEVGLREESLVAAVTRYPDDMVMQRMYGQWLQRHGQGAKALADLQGVIQRRPFDAAAEQELARAYAYLGQREEALDVLTTKGAARRYADEEALAQIGSFYITLGRLTEAQWIFKELHERAPRRVDALVNLASAASHSNNVLDIQRYASLALEIDPESVQAMICMGNYYAKTNDPQTACTWFERAVDKDPYHYLAHISWGVQLLRCEQTQEGMMHMIKAMELKPDFIEGYQLLAKLLQEGGRPEQARHYQGLYELFKN